ncbi:interferon-induced protein with tetratricopeptide repeats 1-like [Hypanus sabinus]|uniref:interferon-induced protein with tetratricopeptide repeats 1-like n=1 Tax=Hypanus sabinus TaxID=79690 RepID=UPI0028C50027|nr:interferon-induced protein with tetratricopeptide repeats 1-like [Hypanus sabinus]
MNLEKWADRKLSVNAQDSKALGIKAILYQLIGIKDKVTEYFDEALKFDPDIESEYWWLSGEKHHFSVPRSGAMLRLLAKKRKSAIVGELNVCNTPGDLLKEKLDQLQCHFTWRPQKETIDLDDMRLKLQNSLRFSVKHKAQFYNHLAFINCLQGHFEEAFENLMEAEKFLREEYKDEFERRSIITYGNFAWVHYHMGQLTEAQSYLDKLEMICKPLSDGPRYTAMIPEVYGEKGWSLMSSGAEYYEEAKACFAKGLKQDPFNLEWMTGFASAQTRLTSTSGTPESRDQSQSWESSTSGNKTKSTIRDLLKEKLDQLQCHFTWRPQMETIDLDNLMFKLQYSLTLGVKYQAASYNHLAFVNCLQGNFEEAIENLKEAEKILMENHKDEYERRSIITYGNFAWVHYHMGQLTEAQSYLDKLEMICKPLSDGPRYTAMIPEVYGEKGWSLLGSGAEYYEEAKECLAKALEQDPDNTEWIMGYATALFRLEAFSGTPESRDQSRSVKYFRRVLELDPDDAVAMVLLALKLQRLRQNVEANELVEQALKKTSGLPYVLRYAAKYYRIRGSVEKAIELLKKALELTPNSCFIHHQLGLCYRSKLKYTRCRSPHNPVFHQKAELINLCKYHFEKSFEHCRRSATKPQLDFAQICITSGEYSRAEETYRRLVELVDIRPENMQRICLEAGLFELYQKRSETNAVRLFLKGVKIEYNSRERENCRMNLEKWADRKLRINAHDSKALGIKAILYQLNGIKDKATEYFEKALKFDPGNEEYVSALSQLHI